MRGAELLSHWRRLGGHALGRRLFSLALGRAVPYTGSISPEVQELAPGRAVVAMRDRRAVRNHLRSTETPYRYGGEEFAVVLPGGDFETARTVAERIRHAIADQPFSLTDGFVVPMTCSLGVAELKPGMSLHAFIDAADQALLNAKRAGKNRVLG